MPLAGSSLQQMSKQPAPRYCLAERADRRHVRRSHRFAYVLREVDRALRVALSECAIGPDATVVDYGCGNKPYAELFSGHRYLGADLPGNVVADVEISAHGGLPLPCGSADLVISTQVLEHVGDPALYLRECARVLVPHGRLVVSTHGLMFHHPDPEDYWRWTPAGLRRALSESGLEVEWLRGVVGTPAFGIQLASDGLYYKLGSRMRPPLSLATNSLMAVVDSMTSRESKDANAVVIVAQATIPA